MENESLEINGSTFIVQEVLSRNKHATARLRGNAIVISLPSRWPLNERERVKANLKSRAIRSIEKGRWKPDAGRKLDFKHGQKLVVLGMEFEICIVDDAQRIRMVGRRIEIPAARRSAPAIRKKISQIVLPELARRVEELNALHFQSHISAVRIRDSVSRWGSCSTKGVISLNFRLLLMPPEILDYVIIHELAHTKFRNHGPRFWALVERIMPDHKEKRKWLRENGWALNNARLEPLEEPY